MSDGVLLDGWYGKRNTGDDAFCLVGALRYGARLPAGRVAILADARGVPELPGGVRPVVYRAGVRGVHRATCLAAALRWRNVVHLGGSRFDRGTTRIMRDQARLARTGLVTLHGQAVSIGPFSDPAHAAEQSAFLSRFTTISVRDSASLERARLIGLEGVVRAFDVAVLLPELVGVAVRADDHLHGRRAEGYPDGPVVGVALRDPDASARENPDAAARREAHVASALRGLAARFPGLRARFLCFGAADLDVALRVAAQVRATCRTQIVPYSRRTAVMLRAVAACDLVLAMRLHAAIFSYAVQVPFAVIDYHGKCGDFAADVGMDPRMIYPVTGPLPRQCEHLVAVLDSPADAYRPPALPLRTARELAEGSFVLVDRRASVPAGGGAPAERAPCSSAAVSPGAGRSARA